MQIIYLYYKINRMQKIVGEIFLRKSQIMILYSILISVNPSRVENIAKILSKQNVKQRNHGSESVGLGLVLGMTPGKHETGMRMSSSVAKLICSIFEPLHRQVTNLAQQTHSREQTYITLHA